MGNSRKTIRELLTEETGLGVLGAASEISGTTTLTATGSSICGPYPSQRFPRGSPIRITSGATAGANTSVSQYKSESGVLVLVPAIVAVASGVTFEVWTVVNHIDRIDEAINRCLTRLCWRYVRLPLTMVEDGDMGEDGADAWTPTTATVVKAPLVWPETFGARYLVVTNTDPNGYAAGQDIGVTPGDEWVANAICRAPVAGATAKFVVRDVTNNADITLAGSGGTYAGTGWEYLKNTFIVPANCRKIQVRLGSAADDAITHWREILLYPTKAKVFPLPSRVTNPKSLGLPYYRTGSEFGSFGWSPYNTGGRRIWYTGGPTGLMVTVSRGPGSGSPIFLEELRAFDSLDTDDAETDANLSLVLAGTKYLIFKTLADPETQHETVSGMVVPDKWSKKRDDARREYAKKAHTYNPKTRVVIQ